MICGQSSKNVRASTLPRRLLLAPWGSRPAPHPTRGPSTPACGTRREVLTFLRTPEPPALSAGSRWGTGNPAAGPRALTPPLFRGRGREAIPSPRAPGSLPTGLSESGDPGVSRVISGGHIRTCGEPCSAHKGRCQAALALAWVGGLAVTTPALPVGPVPAAHGATPRTQTPPANATSSTTRSLSSAAPSHCEDTPPPPHTRAHAHEHYTSH